MYGIYVHIKALTYVTFPKLIRQKYKRKCQTRIYSCCMPYNVCDVLNSQLNMALDQTRWKSQKEAFVTMWKRITKTQELWTNKWCYNGLCIEIVMIYGIINLNNHMNFVRYLDVLQSTVVFHFN